ncbi:MAG: cysteine rich repeat-containing protein [Myxococcaceae bacterium]
MRRPVFAPAVLLALVALAGLGASTALAQQTPATTPSTRPCAADVARLCPGTSGQGSAHQCLRQNADQLSAECKAHIELAREHFHAAREACQADASKFCADMKPGHGRIVACLSQHSAELSDACKAQLPAPRP